MVRLGRLVRFSINPFLEQDSLGFNSYASKPAGEGLAMFLELAVELTGPIAPQTGLLVNVTDIDRVARRVAVPVFADGIRRRLGRREHVSLAAVAQMLRSVHGHLVGQFPNAQVDRLALRLNPYRKLAMDTQEPGVVYFSEKFEFAATHKLWNDSFSDQQNRDVFGKCANPSGHGHNYLVEVTVKIPGGPQADDTQTPNEALGAFRIGQFECIVDARLMQLLDHKNLNVDVPEFGTRIVTVENLAIFAWQRLAGRFDPAQLHCVTIWESDRTYCSYYGS
jgi:6-pyruvoyltetrahydropterin/6-carboxytetrahydropterin synthase